MTDVFDGPTGVRRPRDPEKVKRIHEIVMAVDPRTGKRGTYAAAGEAVGLDRDAARYLHLRWYGRAKHRTHPGKNVRSPDFVSPRGR